MSYETEYENLFKENNAPLEEGIRITFPTEFKCDIEKLRPFLLSLYPYYAATVHLGTERVSITCLNDIERDPMVQFADMLNVVALRENKISDLLEAHGLPKADLTLYFSQMDYGTFAIRSTEEIYADELQLSRIRYPENDWDQD
ncbi:hypothetical protein NSU18_18730 [Paenibacillus sp. FSL H8-0048]|uniref:hypothetical protein n=1 Tax=Paenibacillus sp. FSL H8-0048 TaxID=2954508 RepID=UPI0030F8466D